MTLPTNAAQITYTGNGSANSFAFPYLVEDSSHFKVYHDGVLQASGFTLSGIGTASVTVTYTVAPADGVEILFLREVPLTQESDYVANDPLPAETLEGDFDLATMGLQQLDNRINRTLRAPDGETIGSMVLGNKAARANKYIQFDANGLPTLVAAGPDSSGGLVTSSSGTTARSLAARFDDVINVKDYGATGDGVTDDTTAITAAIAIGKSVFFPDGTYIITSNLSVSTAGMHLFGSGQATIKQTTSGERALEITASDVIVESLVFEGPTATDTQVNGEDAIYAFGADSSNYIDNVYVRNCKIFNWGESAFRGLFISSCGINSNYINRIGHYGILILSGNYVQCRGNRINDISPGLGGVSPRLNAYGITFTRNQNNTTISPQSVGCIADSNVITNVPSWEALDTHGGVQCQFTNNFCRNISIGVAVTISDDGAGTNIPPQQCTVKGNICISNTAASGDPISTGITVSGTGPTNGAGFVVEGNLLKGFGREDGDAGWSNGALRVSDVSGCSVCDNVLIDSNMIGIDLENTHLGTVVDGNVLVSIIETNSQNDGISAGGPTIRAIIDNNVLNQVAAGTPTLISTTQAPSASYGITVGANNVVYGSGVVASGTTRLRVIDGALLRSAHAWCTFDGTDASPITPNESFNVTDVTTSGTGLFTINFSTNLNLANYIVLASTSDGYVDISTKAVGSLSIVCRDETGTPIDPVIVDIMIMGRG